MLQHCSVLLYDYPHGTFTAFFSFFKITPALLLQQLRVITSSALWYFCSTALCYFKVITPAWYSHSTLALSPSHCTLTARLCLSPFSYVDPYGIIAAPLPNKHT